MLLNPGLSCSAVYRESGRYLFSLSSYLSFYPTKNPVLAVIASSHRSIPPLMVVGKISRPVSVVFVIVAGQVGNLIQAADLS